MYRIILLVCFDYNLKFPFHAPTKNAYENKLQYIWSGSLNCRLLFYSLLLSVSPKRFSKVIRVRTFFLSLFLCLSQHQNHILGEDVRVWSSLFCEFNSEQRLLLYYIDCCVDFWIQANWGYQIVRKLWAMRRREGKKQKMREERGDLNWKVYLWRWRRIYLAIFFLVIIEPLLKCQSFCQFALDFCKQTTNSSMLLVWAKYVFLRRTHIQRHQFCPCI